MGRTAVSDQQAGWSGGLNTVSDPAFLRPDQGPQLTNFRLSAYGAALKRLGSQLTTAAAITTFDTASGLYGGIYWALPDKIYASGAATGSTTASLWETSYPSGAFTAAWANVATMPQYRPAIFTDGTNTEVVYWAGDNTQPMVKLVPNHVTVTHGSSSSAATSGAMHTSATWTHTVGVGSNGILVVALANDVTAANAATSVVWDPAGANLPLTKFKTLTDSYTTLEWWYLLAPPNATKSIVATWPTSAYPFAASANFFGVNQTTPFLASSPRTASGTAGSQPSITVPSQQAWGSTPQTFVIAAANSGAPSDVLATASTCVAIGSGGDPSGFGTPTFVVYATAQAGLTTLAFTGASYPWIELAAVLNNAPNSPDVSTVTMSATVATVKGITVFNSRLWGWNSPDVPNGLFYSNLSSAVPTTGGDSLGDAGNGGGTIVIDTFGQAAIVACAPVGTSLLIFHDRGVSRLTGFGQSDITVAPEGLTADVGMGTDGTPDGVVVYNNVAYFLSERGLYAATEGSVAPVGTPDKPDPLVPLLRNGTITTGQVLLRYNRQFDEVWVIVTGVGIYVFNTILGAWSGPFTGSYASGMKNIFEVTNSATGESFLWRQAFNGNAGSGLFISECDRVGSASLDDIAANTGTGGTTFSSILQMHRMFYGDRSYSKVGQFANVTALLATNNTAPVITIASQYNSPATWTFPTGTGVQQDYYAQIGGPYGPWVDLTITDNGSGASQYETIQLVGNRLGQR